MKKKNKDSRRTKNFIQMNHNNQIFYNSNSYPTIDANRYKIIILLLLTKEGPM